MIRYPLTLDELHINGTDACVNVVVNLYPDGSVAGYEITGSELYDDAGNVVGELPDWNELGDVQVYLDEQVGRHTEAFYEAAREYERQRDLEEGARW